MRNGGIGRGWYEDHPNAEPITEHEKELNEFFESMLRNKLKEVFDLISQKHREKNEIHLRGK